MTANQETDNEESQHSNRRNQWWKQFVHRYPRRTTTVCKTKIWFTKQYYGGIIYLNEILKQNFVIPGGDNLLINYSFQNFRSFLEPAEFSMLAKTGKVLKRYPDNYSSLPNGSELLKSAVIVGENAGGKSNFIYSLQFLKSLFRENWAVKAMPSNINSNAKPDSRESFEIEFSASNNLIYRYALVIDEKRIIEEKLSYVKDRSRKYHSLFQVQWDEETSSYAFEYSEIEGAIRQALQNNAGAVGLFVTRLALLGNAHAIAVISWMTNTLFPQSMTDGSLSVVRTEEHELEIMKDPRYLDIFRMVDYSICGVQIDAERPYSKSIVMRRRADGSIMERELQYDSTGVKEFFVWAVQIFRVVYENKVVFADEMDRVLNPVLSERVIAYVNGKQHSGQFIFSTHNVLHLDLKTYMKEQIYFITKTRNLLSSELYSLSDFPEVRYETTKIYEFYMKGILGGTADE